MHIEHASSMAHITMQLLVGPTKIVTKNLPSTNSQDPWRLLDMLDADLLLNTHFNTHIHFNLNLICLYLCYLLLYFYFLL